MSFECFLVNEFDHKHENEMFLGLFEKLSETFSEVDQHCLLMGNIIVGRNELDALFVKPGAVSVVELKSGGGRFEFSENGHWTIEGRRIRGGNKANPFLQVRSNKFETLSWFEGFSREKNLLLRDLNWGHISGYVVFDRPSQLFRELPDGN